jgi:hypothetical protein
MPEAIMSPMRLKPHRASNRGQAGPQALRRATALATAFVLLPLSQVELFAQAPWSAAAQYNTAQYSQYGPSPYGYSQQYAPAPQPGYNTAQPGYGQQQPSPQSPYGQQTYPQQPLPQQQNYTPPYAYLDSNEPQQGAQQAPQGFTAEQLEQMLAPIALYPDALLAQVLAAATYPAQVTAADQWRRSMGNAPAEQIAAGSDAQNWDPSVKALTAFPQVLAQMDYDLRWTTDLGNAYYNQPQDVMQTVQVLRQRAQAAGTLQSTPQEQVIDQQGSIELAPPSPNVVYVPSYDPWDVYGAPIQPYPGFSLLGTLGSFFGSSVVQYGLGIAMSAFERTPFGWLSWALDWLGNSILFNHSSYASESTTVAHFGNPYGGGYAGRHPGGIGRPQPEGYGRGQQQGRGYGARPEYAEGYGRSVRPALPQQYAHNRPPAEMPVRPQPYSAPRGYATEGYGRGGYGTNYAGAGTAYGGRTGGYESAPQQSWRAPQAGYGGQRDYTGRGGYGQQVYTAPHSSFFGKASSGYKERPEHSSGGFHLFGGGHNAPHYSTPKASKSFGGGKHEGGGHSGGHGWDHHR